MTTATVERTVDSFSGEVLSQTVTTREKSDEPDYVKLYIAAWASFKDLKGVNSAFVAKLLPFMAYANQKQVLALNSAIKRMIAADLGWSEKTALKRFSTELKLLEKAGVLVHVGRDMWCVNPELVGKGSWHDIKALRATFEVIGPKAGTVTVETDRDE